MTQRPESIVSGRQAMRGPRRVSASEQGESARALHDAVGGPMLATAAERITGGPEWIYEIKYDGYRLQACKAGDEVRLYTRQGNDWTDRFPPIARAVAELPARECVVDGEACAVDATGKPSFQALQQWFGGGSKHAHIGFAAFDLLWLDGRDVRRLPIEARRELLEKLLEGQKAPLSFSRAVEGDLRQLLAAAKDARARGPRHAKRKGSAYVGERSADWLKLRSSAARSARSSAIRRCRATRRAWARCVLAVVEGGQLVYAGRVGAGFDDAERRAWAVRLAPGPRGTPAVRGRVEGDQVSIMGDAAVRRRVRLRGVERHGRDARSPASSASARTSRRWNA